MSDRVAGSSFKVIWDTAVPRLQKGSSPFTLTESFDSFARNTSSLPSSMGRNRITSFTYHVGVSDKPSPLVMIVSGLLLVLTMTWTVATDGAVCSTQNTLADVGIENVLSSPLLKDFPLEDIYETFGDLYTVRIALTNGELSGLENLRRGRRNYMNVTDCGLSTMLQIEGGPLVITYSGKMRSALLDGRFRIHIFIRHFRMTIYVKEPAPNNLLLKVFGFEAHPPEVAIWQVGSNNIFFDIAAWFAERPVGNKVGKALGPVIHRIVYQFLGMVELYAVNGTKIGSVKHPREDFLYEPSLLVNLIEHDLLEEGLGPEYFPPVPWADPTSWGLFGYCIKRIVLASGLDPVVFTDVEDVTWGDSRFQISNVTVDGLAFLRRGGDNFAIFQDCGLVARIGLTFENVRVKLYASNSWINIRIDVRILEVDFVLEVRENNQTLEIQDYQLNFTVPVEWDAYVLNPVIGPLVELFGGYTNRRLSEDEANKLEDASRKYVEQSIFKIQEFITDPASMLPWSESIIESYRRSKEAYRL